MIRPARIASARGENDFAALGSPIDLEALLPGSGAWELEIGFGKGRYLVARASAEPGRRFLGIEVAGEYYREVARRVVRRGLANVALLCGEAQYLLATALPAGFAGAVHVYFPDPWPKAHHHRRRLFSPASLDLVLRPLAVGGELWFASDHLAYGAEVEAVLAGCPELVIERLPGGWPEGPRTHYESKYVAEGRPILRLHATVRATPRAHPEGRAEMAVAMSGSGPAALASGEPAAPSVVDL